VKRTLPWLLIALCAVSLAACDRVSQSAMDLVAGDCFKVPDGDTITDVQRSPCNEGHSGEVFLVADYPSQDTYPAEEAFGAWVQANCGGQAFTDYVGKPYDDAEDIDYSYFFPTEEGWGKGDHEMTCILVPAAGGEVSVSYRAAPVAS
jgi:hypothetical protein